MLEATLDLMEEGIAVLDEQSNVLHWNHAAAVLTGYEAEDVTCRKCPEGLFRIDKHHHDRVGGSTEAGLGPLAEDSEVGGTSYDRLTTERTGPASEQFSERPTLVSMHHKLGHTVPGMLRKVTLQDLQGTPMGAALLFYPVEEVDSLPRGETGEGAAIEASQEDMEERLDAAHHQWMTSGMPFGLLWITVDQARSLRKTHGREACEAMLRSVEQTLLRQMGPAETIGRWGDNEFLVIAHERSAELLTDHGRRLAGLARTVDFRWWGDRVGLTLSIGASYAIEADTLQSLLNRALHAMRNSEYAGGNHVTEARGEECLHS
ncbi:MAG: diguanylate cyclase domain-containing protein [Acidobacteriaceae bacterium]